ncbi:tetratricopeptide repeat protein, partial [Brachyspira hampsonii]
IYITHNEKIENSLNYSITNFAPSLNNIIIAKEDYYTNIIISKISSNKNITNNIILKSTSLDNLETSLKNILDNYNIRLQTSINETVKSSNNLINFWFAFLTVIIIVFTLITLVINNNILKKSKRKIKVFNNNYNKKVKEIKMHIKNFEKLKKENDKTIEINKLYNLANTLFDLKDYNNSIYYYDKVLELDNNFIYSIYNKAVSYYYINDYNKCTDNFIYLYNKESSIKDLALKNIIELANKNVEKAIQFCLSENIDYKSLQQNEEKISIFDRIRNILS